MERQTILLADDDEIVRELLELELREAGFNVAVASDGRQALKLINEEISVALLDLRMPGLGGQECVEYLASKFPATESIIITASTDVADAIRAMKAGAFDYLTKPVDPEEVVALVKRVAETSRLKKENRQLRDSIGLPFQEVRFVGNSPQTRRLLQAVEKVAQLDSTVLITGESGTGKGLVARLIHSLGRRKNGNFVTVSCTALPRELVEAELFGHEKGAFTGADSRRLGRLEVADGGTLFLDEIGDMPLELQPKLLNVLQDRFFTRIGGNVPVSVDSRVIAATHQDLKVCCDEKRFRQDLYYRLNVLPIEIPPLRARREDIPVLIEFFLDRIAERRGLPRQSFTPEALAVLEAYSWPGNARELENVVERVTAFSDEWIAVEDLPKEVALEEGAKGSNSTELAGLPLSQIEEIAIVQTLDLCNGNRARAARLLGISEKSIYNKMRRLGIKR